MLGGSDRVLRETTTRRDDVTDCCVVVSQI